jgi:hypothetical protein
MTIDLHRPSGRPFRRALSFQVESDSAPKSLISSIILSEKSPTFRDDALMGESKNGKPKPRFIWHCRRSFSAAPGRDATLVAVVIRAGKALLRLQEQTRHK